MVDVEHQEGNETVMLRGDEARLIELYRAASPEIKELVKQYMAYIQRGERDCTQ